MLIKVCSIVAAFAILMPTNAAFAQSRDSSLADFKRELMPQVGEHITVEGILKPGKLGWLIAFKDWGLYIKATKDSDISKMNGLNRFDGRPVKVTGTLRYFPEPADPNRESPEAIAPEHFYFDIAETNVIGSNPPRLKQSKRNRTRRKSMLKTPPNNRVDRSAVMKYRMLLPIAHTAPGQSVR